MENSLQNLNQSQKEAVTHDEGPLLIVAGAGTGKTTVITERIAYLIKEGRCKPEEILALTFTEKAAGEMEERVDKALPYGYVDLWISTFHAFCEKILKESGLEVGLSNDFKLLDTTSQWLLMRQNLDRFNLDYYRPLGNPAKFIHALISHFSRAKDENITPEEYLKYAEDLKLNADSAEFIRTVIDDKEKEKLSKPELKEILSGEISKQEEVANAYHTYQQILLENNALDFGDLINYCLKLFKERKNVLNYYRKKFKYILVDEFQDTNYAQYELIKLLAAPKNNITVVGDDDQCLPPDTLIKTNNGDKKIRDIKQGESVLSAIGRGYTGFNKVTKIFQNKKKRKLITFTTKNGKTVTTTDNHKMFCFIPAIDDKKYYFVYLMHRKDLGWRIGTTNDIASRLRLERSADRIIGIKSCNSDQEARFYETLYSLKYNIPTNCFKKRKNLAIKDEWLIKLFKEINTENNVKNLASDLNIDLNSHHLCLAAVNRGNKVRIKINIEMCYRHYNSKNQKTFILQNPKVSHVLNIETSDKNTIKKLKDNGYNITKTKKGYRLRIANKNLKRLGEIALNIEKLTGGIINAVCNIGRQTIQSRKAIIIPAKNILIGQYIPIFTKDKGIIYDRVINKKIQEEIIQVYDLEVENSHNFIANDVVVHNSIYKFRGASISNIIQFKDDYPEAKELFLNTNYRSRQEILDLSYEFIKQNNPYRLEVKLSEGNKKLSKKLDAFQKGGGKIEHLHGTALADEVKITIEKIIELYNQDKELNWSDFAILIRANNSAKEFIYALEKAGLPFSFIASKGLYQKQLVLDILAYLKLLDDYHEGSVMYRILSMPTWRIDAKDIINLNYWAKRKGWSLFETCRQAATLKNISATTQNTILKILGLIEKHTQLVKEDKKATEIIQAFLEDSGYLETLTKEDSEFNREQLNYLNQFYKKARDFEQESPQNTVKDFLELLELELEAGEEGSLKKSLEDECPDTIKIMTIHAAKGLEFKYVFIANMVDRKFPSTSRRDAIELPDKLIKEIIPEGDIHLQEERRLFYVAMTRAKEKLYLTSAEDYGGARKKKLSRFITELMPLGFELSDAVSTETKESLFQQKEKIKQHDLPVKEFLPSKFSFTQVKAFDSCPYQYRFSHILRIPTRGKPQFSFGKSIHSALQKFFGLMTHAGGGQTDLFGTVENYEPKLEDLIKFYEESFIDDWYPDRITKDKYFEKGKKALKIFFENHKDNWPKVKFLEYPFNLHFRGAEKRYTFYGMVDRIDKTENGVRIVDYKTGNAKSKLSLDDKEQLLLYQMAVQEVLGEKVEELVFYYIENNQPVSFLGTEKELEKVRDKFLSIIHEIEKGNFPPKPGMGCQWCDFNRICDFKSK